MFIIHLATACRTWEDDVDAFLFGYRFSGCVCPIEYPEGTSNLGPLRLLGLMRA